MSSDIKSLIYPDWQPTDDELFSADTKFTLDKKATVMTGSVPTFKRMGQTIGMDSELK